MIGAGPNGLVAANVLADSGQHVVSARNSLNSAAGCAADRPTGFHLRPLQRVYPLAAASPRACAHLGLERYWLR